MEKIIPIVECVVIGAFGEYSFGKIEKMNKEGAGLNF